MNFKLALCFDDVLLTPKHWSGGSRKEVDISTRIAGLPLSIPIISANMPTVTGLDMAVLMNDHGGLGIFDRMGPIEEQLKKIKEFRTIRHHGVVGASIGIGKQAQSDANMLVDAGVNLLCIDVAHADQRDAFDILEKITTLFKVPIVFGNFAVPPKYNYNVSKMQNVALKLGVGSGAACTTRIETGCGLPTLESVFEFTSGGKYSYRGGLIADGGIKNSGDCVKALAAGASAVMIGSLLAGTKESPGSIIKDDRTGNKYKIYRGNASAGSKVEAGLKEEFIEGAEMLVPYKGSADAVLNQLVDGIRSGFTYCGSRNVPELWEKAEFVKISSASQRENRPHGLFR